MIDSDALPWSQDAEQSVLGGLLLDNRAWDRVGDLLTPHKFYDRRHGAIFLAIGDLINANRPADIITVQDQLLRQRGAASHELDLVYLNSLINSTPSAHNIRRYAEIVAEKWAERAIIEEADDAMSVAQGPGTAGEKLDRILTGFGALERDRDERKPSTMGEVMMGVVDHLNDLAQNGQPPGWSTRFPGLDKKLRGGFRGGRVYLLGGRPGMGKSALALWWQSKAACHDALICLYLSQEMPKQEVGERAAAQVGRISYERIQTGTLTDAEWGKLSEAVERLNRADFHVDEQAGLTGTEIRAKARYIKGLNLLVLDYIQLCKGNGESEANRNAELEAISRAVKSLAKEINCAVLVLSALNRRVDERPHGRAIMSDFKDCGALEADADVIMTLFKIKDTPATNGVLMGMDVLKNRQGSKGSLVLHFWPDMMDWGESEYELEDLLNEKRGKKGDL